MSRDLITKENYKLILQKCAAGEFRDYTEPLYYLKNFIVIDLQEYPSKPEEHLETIYRKTATVFPGLSFDSMQYKIVKDRRESLEDFVVYNLSVTLKANGNSYRYASYFDAEYKNKVEDKLLKIPENYHQIFNKMLSDQSSPYRLHQVTINDHSFGILAMTKKQFEELMWSYSGMSVGSYIQVSYENFNNKITQKKIEDAVALYDSIGLFSHLSKEEKMQCINEVLNKEVNYFSDILSSFKNLVFEIDLEYGVDDHQYQALTKQIEAISKGHFAPTNIVDTYTWKNRQSFDYGFTLNGKTYKTKLSQPDDWLDLKFWELIEQALEEQDKNGRFYHLHPNDGIRQIFLTNEQAEILKKQKMIELSEDDISD